MSDSASYGYEQEALAKARGEIKRKEQMASNLNKVVVNHPVVIITRLEKMEQLIKEIGPRMTGTRALLAEFEELEEELATLLRGIRG
jgi:hypothetical protein